MPTHPSLNLYQCLLTPPCTDINAYFPFPAPISIPTHPSLYRYINAYSPLPVPISMPTSLPCTDINPTHPSLTLHRYQCLLTLPCMYQSLLIPPCTDIICLLTRPCTDINADSLLPVPISTHPIPPCTDINAYSPLPVRYQCLLPFPAPISIPTHPFPAPISIPTHPSLYWYQCLLTRPCTDINADSLLPVPISMPTHPSMYVPLLIGGGGGGVTQLLSVALS